MVTSATDSSNDITVSRTANNLQLTLYKNYYP